MSILWSRMEEDPTMQIFYKPVFAERVCHTSPTLSTTWATSTPDIIDKWVQDPCTASLSNCPQSNNIFSRFNFPLVIFLFISLLIPSCQLACLHVYVEWYIRSITSYQKHSFACRPRNSQADRSTPLHISDYEWRIHPNGRKQALGLNQGNYHVHDFPQTFLRRLWYKIRILIKSTDDFENRDFTQ